MAIKYPKGSMSGHARPRVPKVEPTPRVGKVPSGGNVGKRGNVRETEGQRRR